MSTSISRSTPQFIATIVAFFTITISYSQISYEAAFPNLRFNRPVEIQNANDGSDRLFVVEHAGVIKVFPNSTDVNSSQVQTFLDIQSQVSFSSGQEIGLLGLAFHPDYSTNGYFYVFYTDQPSNYRVNVVRYQVNATNPNVADTSSATTIYSFVKNQNNSNHNGGKIAFGPDGYLYISIGDGGGGGDPRNNAQNLNNAFGSIVRIDVDLDGTNPVSGNGQYEIPSDNPRVGLSGLDELYAWGIRNTWKFSFDGNVLWGADVGQNALEEINIIEKGGNYGWKRFEGTNTYSSGTSLITSPDTKPIYTYNRSSGDVSVTGGYVYRGSMTTSSLQGKYIYGDYVSGRVWALDYNETTGQATNDFLFRTSGGVLISSFGLDEDGDLYFSDYKSSAQIYKITDENAGPTEVQVNGVGNWVNSGVDGVNGIVEAVVNDGSDNFYVAGNFSNASGIPVGKVAKYSKSAGWESFLNSTDGEINTVAIASNGDVYVGGEFTQIDGIAASNVAFWNGTVWSPLGSGTDDRVDIIQIDSNDNIYVGGSFITAGGITVNYIALWDGTWNALTDVTNSVAGTNNEIRAISFDETERLYVGGNFDTAGGNSAPRIAVWDGTNWGTLGSGTSGFVQSIVVTTDYIYAGGNFSDAGSETVNRIGRWNRTSSTWESLNFGLSGNVNSMAYDGSHLYVGGAFLTASDEEQVNEIMNFVARWSNANGWEALGPNTNVGVTTLVNSLALTTDNAQLLVGGNFSSAGTKSVSNIAFWGENVGCQTNIVTPQYTVNGTANSGATELTITEGSTFELGITDNLYIEIEGPNNNNSNGDLSIASITFDDEGVYSITTTEGCSTTFELSVIQDPNGDEDNDGVINSDDLCPNTPNGESVDANGCGESQKDDDNDGVFNNLDLCPNTPNGESVDSDGCGESQKDDDNDGVFNNVDICPNTPSNETADNLGCGPSQQDIDNDGVLNTDDLCNGTPAGEPVDANGCSESQLDDDNDGVFNTEDLCPNTPNGESVDANGCGQSQLDDDNDGVFNNVDQCPNTPNGEAVDVNGCGQSQLDDDDDGVFNTEDLCPNTPNGESVNSDGCGQSQLDDDNDGIFNNVDLCPGTPNGESVDANGCSESQRDDDNDGVLNPDDLCPDTPNGETVDSNGCGSSQLDDDNDGVFNNNDICPNTPAGESVDADGCSDSQRDDDNDGVLNPDDLCPDTPNGEAVDSNGCGQSQLDNDNDGVLNPIDICPNTPNGETVDANGCSDSQLDDDNDGVSNGDDLCPNTPADELANLNGCSASQLDADNDGVSDADDICPNTPVGESVDAQGCGNSQQDIDSDGVPNSLDLCNDTPSGESVDVNGCSDSQLDDDNDGVSNADDVCPNTPAGVSVDFEGCELPPDDDGDGVPNSEDACPNTPVGLLVGLDGCEIVNLPATNFSISSIGNTCIGVFDGQILIEAERNLNYIARLRSVSFAETQNFNNSILFDNLPAGTFELCISINGVTNYESCSTVVVDSPTSLGVIGNLNSTNNVLNLEMSGGQEYIVTINESTFSTTSDKIELNLRSGENKVMVTTGKECQGVFEETYIIIDDIMAYPNPFNSILTVAKNNNSENNVFINLFNISGQLILTGHIDNSDTSIDLDTTKLAPGFYILEIYQNGNQSNLKLIKQ